MSMYGHMGMDNAHLISMMRMGGMGGMSGMSMPQRPMYASPAESYISDISDISTTSYNDMPLFGDGTISPSDTSLTTPDVNDDDCKDYMGSGHDRYGNDKKPMKKRKSWGQELPQPTTNLPPRKRAKTVAEKEQRRIERVLRNRAAAQSSRERKRQEVEALEDHKKLVEKDNVTLQRELNQAKNETSMHQRKIMQLMSELNSLKRVIASSGLPTPDNQTLSYDSSARASPQPETFKQEPISPDSRLMDDHLSYGTMSPPHSHLNPNIVLHSPEYEADDGFGDCDVNSGSGLAQHPAAVLCDLQCQPDFEIQPRPPPRSPLIQTVFDQAQLLSDDLLSRASSLLSPLTRIGSSSRPPPLQATSACTNTMTMSLLSPLRTPPFSMNW